MNFGKGRVIMTNKKPDMGLDTFIQLEINYLRLFQLSTKNELQTHEQWIDKYFEYYNKHFVDKD